MGLVERAEVRMKAARQTTLRDQAAVSGIGVHSGLPATLTMFPAAADTGIVFVRCGVEGQPDREIRANVRAVTATEFATVLGDAKGPLCSTAEHVLAALSGLGVDNAIIEIDGPEVPIMDGSAAPFVAAIDRAGVVPLSMPRRYIRILKSVRVAKGDAYGELRPNPQGFRIELDINFDHPLIGRQGITLDLEPDAFRRELARARTFGFMRDVAKLWSAGYALGASFENTLVVNENRLLNPEGLRYADEFARHKALDAIGDLALAGAPLLGAYRSVCGGHKLNHAVLSALMADPSAWVLVDGPEIRPEIRQDAPRRAIRGHADLATGLPAPAYGPEVS
jgi:UDP-3-O-[3-hydroxymyristoyl] N-acetylglucosamine deacetylase